MAGSTGSESCGHRSWTRWRPRLHGASAPADARANANPWGEHSEAERRIFSRLSTSFRSPITCETWHAGCLPFDAMSHGLTRSNTPLPLGEFLVEREETECARRSALGPPTSRQSWVVGEALVFPRIERCLIGRVKRRVAPIAQRQIRIGEKRRAESNEIGFAAANRRIGAVEIKAAVDDIGAIEFLAQERRHAPHTIRNR